MILSFHATLRPFPANAVTGRTVTWQGHGLPSLSTVDNTNADSFDLSYEALSDRLEQIARLHLELDGSLVWVNADDVSQRVSGQITDNGDRVMFVELRGRCDRNGLEPIMRALGWPGIRVSWHIYPEAILVAGEVFLDLFGQDIRH